MNDTDIKTETTETTDATTVVARVKTNVAPKDFVTTWQSCENRKEVAAKLQMKYNAVVSRERSYRKLGIPLKEMKGNGRAKKLNIDELRAMCQ